MPHTITEFKDWPKGLEVSYHDWIVRDSKEGIMKKLGFKPKYNPTGDKCTYTFKCCLNDGECYFTIYDMSYGRKLGKNTITEYHIGFAETYDDIHNFFPNKISSLNMLEALAQYGFDIDHSSIWKKWHENGVFDDIERIVRNRLLEEDA